MSTYGNYLGYSSEPREGNTLVLDLDALQNDDKRSMIVIDTNIKDHFAYIPYTEPLTISDKYHYTTGVLHSVRLRSRGVIVEVHHYNDDSAHASIRVEADLTAGMMFLKCKQIK